MKKFSVAKILSLVCLCALLLGAFAFAVSATEDEKVEIVAANVYYGDVYQIMYAVNAPEGTALKATDSKGNEIKVVPFTEAPTANINGVDCKVYILETGVAAQAIDEVITLTAEYGNKKAVKNYSILQYIYERCQVVEGAELEMLEALLAYAVKADVFFNGTTESFDKYQYVAATGVTANGVEIKGMYAPGATPFANIDAIEYDAEKYELSIKVNDAAKTLDELKALVVADEKIEVVVEIVENTHVHNYTPKVTDPTCIAAGYTTYTCDGCGDSYTEAGDPATGAHVDNDGDFVCDTEGCEEDLTPATVTTIADVLNAADGTPAVINGTVTAIDAGWNATSNYMSVIITDDAGNTILCYKIGTELKKGDIVTVTGEVGSYNEVKQIVKATAVVNDHDTSYDVVIPEVTIGEALELADGTEIIVTGTVVSAGSWSSSYGNMNVTIKDESGKELYIYRLATKVELNDIIKVTGIMATYQGSRQIGEGSTAEIVGTHTCTNYSEATCQNLAKCVICGATTGELAEHKYVEGVCSVCGHEEGATEVTYTTEEFDIKANTGILSGDKLSISWSSDNVSFINEKDASTTAIRTSDTDHFRVYAHSKVVIKGTSDQLIKKVVITCTSGSYATAMVTSATSAGYSASASGSVVTIELDTAVASISFNVSAQTRVKHIEITYVA